MLFYAEFNFRLFLWLLFNKADIFCAIDLDTILPCLFASKIRKTKRVYDAHELFTELKEVSTNPFSHRLWTSIENFAVPRYKHGYTVCQSIANELGKKHGVAYLVIRNLARYNPAPNDAERGEHLIYAGAVNEGRSFETLIPAMKDIPYPLYIYGDGNFMPQLKYLIREHKVEDKVLLKGMTAPEELAEAMKKAKIGVGLIEATGMNQYLALPNKLFDYIQAETPQLTMDYPEIKAVNKEYEVALLISNLNPKAISNALNLLMEDVVLYQTLKSNCKTAKEELNWEKEEQKLIDFYNSII